MQKPSLPKGTRDFGPAGVQKRRYILGAIETVFRKYGFMPIETPVMENLSTLEGKYGDEGDKLLFRILNSGDAFKAIKEKNADKKVVETEFKNADVSEKGLRYDLTVPFARYVVMNRNDITFPFRRYQMQPVWRADRPQKGRYREFWQCDADVVGSDSLLNELDLIQIYQEAFSKLGVREIEIKINNRKVLAGIAAVVRSEEMMNVIAVAIDKLDKIGQEGVEKELIELGFSIDEINRLFQIINISGSDSELLEEMAKQLAASEVGMIGLQELTFVVNRSHQLNPNINLKIDLSLARGLSYYTGSIFEVVSKQGSLTSSIGGGGRYDNLTGIFGMPGVSGVGISFGLDRIYDVMEELNLFPSDLNATSTNVLVFATDEAEMDAALSLLNKLRLNEISSEIYPDLPKSKKEREKPMVKPMQYADDLKIPFTVFLRSGDWILKDMIQKNEAVSNEQDIIQLLKK